MQLLLQFGKMGFATSIHSVDLVFAQAGSKVNRQLFSLFLPSTFVQCAAVALLIFPVASRTAQSQIKAPPLKAGIIGLDAHALPWTKIINDPNARQTALVTGDVDAVIAAKKKRQPTDRWVTPVPLRWKLPEATDPRLPKHVIVAPDNHFHKAIGFCDLPLADTAPEIEQETFSD